MISASEPKVWLLFKKFPCINCKTCESEPTAVRITLKVTSLSFVGEQAFVPSGRQQLERHPGQVVPTAKNHLQPESFLLQLLSQVNISDTSESEWWTLRESPDTNQCEEELYVKGRTAVWSKREGGRAGSEGGSEGPSQDHTIICCYTSDSPISHALWTTFHTAATDKPALGKQLSSDLPLGKPMPCVCIVDESNIKVFTSAGEDFISSLQFKVRNVWSVRYGLLLERAITPAEESRAMDISDLRLPTLFALVHPLDEITPVVVKQGSLRFMSDSNMKVVFSCDDPSIIMLYDSNTQTHSIWRVRKARPEECQAMCGAEPSISASSSACVSSGNVSNSSFSGLHRSLFGSMSLNAGLSSPYSSGNQSRPQSPMAALSSRCQSPTPGSRSMVAHSPDTWANRSTRHLQSPAHSTAGSSAGSAYGGQSPSSAAMSRLLTDNSVVEPRPVYPEICLELVWKENGGIAAPGGSEKAFLSTDLVGQTYLYTLVSSRLELLCTRIEKANSTEKLIFGVTSTIRARDAAPLPHLHMVVVLEQNGNIALYSGTVPVGKLHLPGIPTQLVNTSFWSPNLLAQFSSPFPRRSSLLPTYRMNAAATPEPMFDERLQQLSPVLHDTSLDVSISDVPVDRSGDRARGFLSIRDPVRNRFTIEYTNGNMFRLSLPETCSSPLVMYCLNTLKQVLQRDLAMQLIIKWYCARNAPGTQDISPNQEWRLFIGVLLSMLGYDVDKLAVMYQPSTETMESPTAQPKKKRGSDCGSEEDWEYLLSSTHHRSLGPALTSMLGLIRLAPVNSSQADEDSSAGRVNTLAILFPHIPLVLFSLHLLYEEMKLNSLLSECLPLLAQLLHQLSVDLKYEHFSQLYWRDFPTHCPVVLPKESQMSDADRQKLNAPLYLAGEAPNIFAHLLALIRGRHQPPPFPYIRHVNQKSKNIVQLVGLLTASGNYNEVDVESFVRIIVPAGSRGESVDTTSASTVESLSAAHKAVLLMVDMGIERQDLQTLPAGVCLLLSEAIYHARENPPPDWPKEAYKLIVRQDLVSQCEQTSNNNKKLKVWRNDRRCTSSIVTASENASPSTNSALATPDTGSRGVRDVCFCMCHPVSNVHNDGLECLNCEVMRLRWSNDQRVAEARRLLQSSQPVDITIKQRPDVSDHEFIEEQEKHLYALCTRTMALPVGRGMMTLRSTEPVMSETLPIPKLCLTGRVPPRGTTVDLSHTEVVPNMNLWPLFHNGVAAGLRIVPTATDIDSSWIVYNKPKSGSTDVPTEHAGFLMALGLNGHLGNLAVMRTYEYLVKCNEMTSVGLLVGIAATKRGTMDVNATKLLSIHVEALLPPTSIELDIPQNIQVAALLGVGLLYQGTGHRHIAEVLLSEIGRPPGPEMENSVDRESYSLAAGLALGHVVLGQGAHITCLADLAVPDKLHYYMLGGRRRPLTGAQKEKYKSPSYQIREGDAVNIDVTSPGATLALGMMYFNTGNKAIADWMKAPDTQYLLDFVRPDFLLLRIIAYNLIMWEDVSPSIQWVDHHVPRGIRPHCLVKPKPQGPDFLDYESLNQAYCNIVAGACFSLGLKFAGSGNGAAFSTLAFFARKFTSLTGKSISELAGKSTIETSLNVILLSLAMVMAGTGDLDTMRICRHLRGRVGPSNTVVTYGSHLATHMALGLLYLGGGRYTLSTSPPALAAMICAFFPKFPTHSNDNRYHLQAFRHLYVLAVEPRLLIPRDIDSSSLCYVHLTVVYLDTKHYQGETAKLRAPCLLPELSTLAEVKIEDDRYWTVMFKRGRNWEHLQNLLTNGHGFLDVKQRAGCLSYREDPQGFRSLLARTLTAHNAPPWSVSAESIFSFSSDPTMVNFFRHFLEHEYSRAGGYEEIESSENETRLKELLTTLVYECVTQDKLSALSIWITLLRALESLKRGPCTMLTWQLKLIEAQVLASDPPRVKSLISPDLALSLSVNVKAHLESWEADLAPLLSQYCSSGRPFGNSDTLRKLTTYITYYEIPAPSDIPKDICSEGKVNPLVVHAKLKNLNLPVTTISKVVSLISAL